MNINLKFADISNDIREQFKEKESIAESDLTEAYKNCLMKQSSKVCIYR
jgi:hypothetical protein